MHYAHALYRFENTHMHTVSAHHNTHQQRIPFKLLHTHASCLVTAVHCCLSVSFHPKMAVFSSTPSNPCHNRFHLTTKIYSIWVRNKYCYPLVALKQWALSLSTERCPNAFRTACANDESACPCHRAA